MTSKTSNPPQTHRARAFKAGRWRAADGGSSRVTAARRPLPKTLVITLTATLVAIGLNVPLIGAVLTSVKPRPDIARGALSFPFSVTGDNYSKALYASGYNFTVYLLNSFMISIGTVVLLLLISYPAAFSITRFSGGSRLLALVSSLRLLPAIFLVIPLYLLFSSVGLLDTVAGLVIANTFANLPLGLLLLVAAFRKFPREVEEAALLDGCGLVRFLVRIAAPLLAPSLVSVSLLTFLFSWSEYLFAVVLTSQAATPVTVGAANFITSYELLWGEVSAATVVSLAPPVIVAVLLQRYLVSGLTAGAVKG